jgi:hypothetical protein
MSTQQHDYDPIPLPDNRSWLQKKRASVAYWWLLARKRYYLALALWWRALPCRLRGHRWVYHSTTYRYCERCDKAQCLWIESGWVGLKIKGLTRAPPARN